MSRYTGPLARLAPPRRQHLSAPRARSSPSTAVPTARRPRPQPSPHNVSEYLPAQEKQKARFTYGLTERQFRNLYDEANRQGVTGENMLRFLELRLDNIVYARLATARWPGQFVNHGHRRERPPGHIPSAACARRDVVALRLGPR